MIDQDLLFELVAALSDELLHDCQYLDCVDLWVDYQQFIQSHLSGESKMLFERYIDLYTAKLRIIGRP